MYILFYADDLSCRATMWSGLSGGVFLWVVAIIDIN